ncbi:MAG: transcriptional repressor [Pseudodesulfovibrio sp.]|uniref:Ferric uptake regulation protein n=1 Tax=Pseudodesulfovibrio aespoeensis (strain ATCC 700646 / DSM 10631 / Aspo-2) TaxID=643562 RepID=E6VZS5_PSEA9|nr:MULTISPECIES: transcriptional repressor [Pseudodesulfovibrio]ADU62903.1 ferric-uptake regulator [Pseudodesulfovibrio aespoeensis Aspo-2]MBU4192407.1 transcriptional repressor [Pseudomonadota bacterium]MBU4244988.1 transcriptional repressor [Pseudomonadota bacterium]MBU4476520.1 transcriptional repressor [Pseudomonadota bacterium]MBU4514625.1 transcriptional repressor [Pseudomonadota bacterium]
MKSAQQVFLDFMRSNSLSLTPQRKAIVETFLESEGHFSAEQLYERVGRRMSDIGQATVYRTLKLLVDSGLADAFDLGEGVTLYEHRYGHEHHDHLVCLVCGRKVEIVDAAIERRQEALAVEYGFTLTRHRMFLFGLCPGCADTARS